MNRGRVKTAKAVKHYTTTFNATIVLCIFSPAFYSQTSPAGGPAKQTLPYCPGKSASEPAGQPASNVRVPPHCLRLKPVLAFMMNSQIYLAGLRAIDPGLVDHFLNTPKACLFTNNYRTNPVPEGWSSQGGLKTPSYTSFKNNFQGNMDPHVGMVIYDNEKWGNSGQTPGEEQIAPAEFTRMFAGLAHDNGLRFVATPSRDLASDQTDYTGGTLDSYYLATGTYSSPGANRPFPAWAAAVSDVFEIQAQVHTTDGQYSSFTAQAVQQANSANSAIQIIVGLSTNYGNALDMYKAVMSTYTLPNVIGYWLNMSNTEADYKEIISFLNMLRAEDF